MSSYIPESIYNMLNYILSKFHEPEDQNQDDRPTKSSILWLNKIESYIVPIQALLIWERPYVSASFLIFINFLFWCIAISVKQVYSFLAVIAILVFLYHILVYKVWPEIKVSIPEEKDTEEWTPVHPQVLSAPELSRYLDEFWTSLCYWWIWVWDLRNRSHGVFCFLAVILFSLLAILGKLIPGVIIIYTLLMTVFLGPGVALYVIPMSWYTKLKKILFPTERQQGSSNQETDQEVEEFLPSVESAETYLQSEELTTNLAGNETLTSKSFEEAIAKELGIESFTSEVEDISLYQGLENFPGVEEEEESGDEIELPQPENRSNSEEKNELNLIPTHFKEDSSDTDEEIFSTGMVFTDIGDNTDSNSSEKSINDNKLATDGNSSSRNFPRNNSDVDMEDYEIVSQADLAS